MSFPGVETRESRINVLVVAQGLSRRCQLKADGHFLPAALDPQSKNQGAGLTPPLGLILVQKAFLKILPHDIDADQCEGPVSVNIGDGAFPAVGLGVDYGKSVGAVR